MGTSMNLPSISVRKSRPEDLPAVEGLLTSASLPLDGVRDHFPSFLVAESDNGVVGAVGMEHYGRSALLRSLVVERDLRSTGIGSVLHDALLTEANRSGVREVVLLTTTAAPFFSHKGFKSVSRDAIEGRITSSPEFTGACPSSAAIMRRKLGQRVLILCTGNVCRSQMAAAFLRSFDPWLDVQSAGVEPAERIAPLTMRVMEEAGISLANARSRDVREFVAQSFDFVVTVCDHARETCPVFTGPVENRRHFGFEDPGNARGTEAERLAIFRSTRDAIRERFLKFYHDELL